MEARLAKQGRELSLLRAQLERYETALRGSDVTVFSQDLTLRYTSISNAMFGRDIENILGLTDEEVMPATGRAEVIALKRGVLDSGQPADREFAVGHDGALRWIDFHVSPVFDENDKLIGLTCAAIDTTERKENEAHLRLLMRELTHRSKNLLAVIQAMARQSERFSGSTEGFLRQFNGRLHALAASHDLLVRGSWHGASLEELIRSQIGHHLHGDHPQVALTGPEITLKPEAAQSLGLALHELATNAVKYGALSVPSGHVEIGWQRLTKEGSGLAMNWTESSGPQVKAPSRTGFGTLVINHNLARSLDAKVTLAYEAGGLHCRIVIPITQILAAR